VGHVAEERGDDVVVEPACELDAGDEVVRQRSCRSVG
jgi:hypothetical protein